MKKILIAVAVTMCLSTTFANEAGDGPNQGEFPSELALRLGSITVGDGYTQAVVCGIHTNEGPSVLSQDCAAVSGKLLKALQKLSESAAKRGFGYIAVDPGQIGGN